MYIRLHANIRENKQENRQKREYPIILCFDYKSRWKRSKRKRGYPANVGARHAVRHVTARHDTPSSRESGVQRYCFALCVDVRLYRQDSVMFTLGCAYVRARAAGTAYIGWQYVAPPSWIAERRKCNFNDSDGPPQSHVVTSQKCVPGSFESCRVFLFHRDLLFQTEIYMIYVHIRWIT